MNARKNYCRMFPKNPNKPPPPEKKNFKKKEKKKSRFLLEKNFN